MPTLSIHGDVHIPDNLIHALGLKPGAELAFEARRRDCHAPGQNQQNLTGKPYCYRSHAGAWERCRFIRSGLYTSTLVIEF